MHSFVLFLKGDAGDSLANHNQMQFSTKDDDNDAYSSNCAALYKGGWWYRSCYHSNLNGLYLGAGQSGYTGNVWNIQSYNCLKKTEMKIRPSQF